MCILPAVFTFRSVLFYWMFTQDSADSLVRLRYQRGGLKKVEGTSIVRNGYGAKIKASGTKVAPCFAQCHSKRGERPCYRKGEEDSKSTLEALYGFNCNKRGG